MIAQFTRRVLHRCFSSPSAGKSPPGTSGSSSSSGSSSGSSSSGGGGGLFGVYNRWLEAAPLATKCATSGLLSMVADIVCQVQFPNKPAASSSSSGSSSSSSGVGDAARPPLDTARVLKFSVLGAFLTGPALHFWYGFLARRFPGATLGNAMQRLACDQLVFAPCFVPTFFASVMVLDGKPHLIREKLAAELFPTMVSKTHFPPAGPPKTLSPHSAPLVRPPFTD